MKRITERTVATLLVVVMVTSVVAPLAPQSVTAQTEKADNWSAVINQSAEGSVQAVEFSPDGDYLAYGWRNNTDKSDGLVIIDTNDGSRVFNSSEFNNLDGDITFSPNGNYIAYTSGNDVKIRYVGNWSEVTTLTQAEADIYSVEFSQNGRWIAYGDNNQDLFVHHVENWTIDLHDQTDTETGAVDGISFSSDGKWMAFGTETGNNTGRAVRVYYTGNWTSVVNLSASESPRSIEFSRDNERLVYAGGTYGGGTEEIYIYDTADWSVVESQTKDTSAKAAAVSLHPNDKFLAYNNGSNVTIRNFGGHWTSITTLSRPSSGALRNVDVSPDGNWIAYGGTGARVYLHEAPEFVSATVSISGTSTSEGGRVTRGSFTNTDGDSRSISFDYDQINGSVIFTGVKRVENGSAQEKFGTFDPIKSDNVTTNKERLRLSGGNYTITKEFEYTGNVQNWTVPNGVETVNITVYGAGGGGGDTNIQTPAGGGNGGYVKGTVNVSPGDTLEIYTAEGGHSPSGISSNQPGDGGWGRFDGGSGGDSSDGPAGGGGGGSSEVVLNDTTIMVAGGGGGGASPDGDGNTAGTGGGGARGGLAGGPNAEAGNGTGPTGGNGSGKYSVEGEDGGGSYNSTYVTNANTAEGGGNSGGSAGDNGENGRVVIEYENPEELKKSGYFVQRFNGSKINQKASLNWSHNNTGNGIEYYVRFDDHNWTEWTTQDTFKNIPDGRNIYVRVDITSSKGESPKVHSFNVTWQNRTNTTDPTISVGGTQLAEYTGQLQENENVTVPLSQNLTQGSNTVSVQSSQSSVVEWKYIGHNDTRTNVTYVSINGYEYAIDQKVSKSSEKSVRSEIIVPDDRSSSLDLSISNTTKSDTVNVTIKSDYFNNFDDVTVYKDGEVYRNAAFSSVEIYDVDPDSSWSYTLISTSSDSEETGGSGDEDEIDGGIIATGGCQSGELALFELACIPIIWLGVGFAAVLIVVVLVIRD